MLDGEGGYTVSGVLRPAAISVAKGYLPLGLAHSVTLTRAVAEGDILTWDDVEIDRTTAAAKLRLEMEAALRAAAG
jgi:predicted homoserine dehydrogenase-like protein